MANNYKLTEKDKEIISKLVNETNQKNKVLDDLIKIAADIIIKEYENNMENQEKIIFEIYGEEYVPVWDKKENCWVGHLGGIKFKIYEKNN